MTVEELIAELMKVRDGSVEVTVCGEDKGMNWDHRHPDEFERSVDFVEITLWDSFDDVVEIHVK